MKVHYVILTCIICIIAINISSNAQDTYSYNANVKSIIEGTCKDCHSFASSYTAVMAKSGFVVPGNPDASELIWRLEGVNASGGNITRMPSGGPYLNDTTIQIIRAWIAQGAVEDVATGIGETVRWYDIKSKFVK